MDHKIELQNGALLIGAIPDKPGRWAHVLRVMVPEHVRRQGFGTQMLKEFEVAAAQAQASRIDVLVSRLLTKRDERPGIIAWLERNGYEEEGIDFGFGPIFVKRLTKLRRRSGRHR